MSRDAGMVGGFLGMSSVECVKNFGGNLKGLNLKGLKGEVKVEKFGRRKSVLLALGGLFTCERALSRAAFRWRCGEGLGRRGHPREAGGCL